MTAATITFHWFPNPGAMLGLNTPGLGAGSARLMAQAQAALDTGVDRGRRRAGGPSTPCTPTASSPRPGRGSHPRADRLRLRSGASEIRRGQPRRTSCWRARIARPAGWRSRTATCAAPGPWPNSPTASPPAPPATSPTSPPRSPRAPARRPVHRTAHRLRRLLRLPRPRRQVRRRPGARRRRRRRSVGLWVHDRQRRDQRSASGFRGYGFPDEARRPAREFRCAPDRAARIRQPPSTPGCPGRCRSGCPRSPRR